MKKLTKQGYLRIFEKRTKLMAKKNRPKDSCDCESVPVDSVRRRPAPCAFMVHERKPKDNK